MVQRAGEGAGGQDHARAGDDEFAAVEQADAAVPHGGNSRQQLPRLAFARLGFRGRAVRIVQLDNHVRLLRQDGLGGHHHRLALHVAEHVVAACEIEQVVQEAEAAADVDRAQRLRLAADDQQRARSRPCRPPRRGPPPGRVRCSRSRPLGLCRKPMREPRSRIPAVISASDPWRYTYMGMLARQAGPAVRLAGIHDDQIWPQRQDALHVGIDTARRRAEGARPPAGTGRSCSTAATRGPAPIANSISVADGTSDTMRVGGAERLGAGREG